MDISMIVEHPLLVAMRKNANNERTAIGSWCKENNFKNLAQLCSLPEITDGVEFLNRVQAKLSEGTLDKTTAKELMEGLPVDAPEPEPSEPESTPTEETVEQLKEMVPAAAEAMEAKVNDDELIQRLEEGGIAKEEVRAAVTEESRGHAHGPMRAIEELEAKVDRILLGNYVPMEVFEDKLAKMTTYIVATVFEEASNRFVSRSEFADATDLDKVRTNILNDLNNAIVGMMK